MQILFSLEFNEQTWTCLFPCFSFFYFFGWTIRTALHKAISVWPHDLSEFRSSFAHARRLELILSFKVLSVSVFCTECRLHRLWYFFIKLFFQFISVYFVQFIGHLIAFLCTDHRFIPAFFMLKSLIGFFSLIKHLLLLYYYLFHSFLVFTVYDDSNSFRCHEVVMSIRRVEIKAYKCQFNASNYCADTTNSYLQSSDITRDASRY